MKLLQAIFITLFGVIFTAVLGPKIYKDFIYSHNETKVFYITTSGHGTGFHVKNSKGKTFLVTNKHVCASVTKGSAITVSQGEREFESSIVKLSKKKDLCALYPVPNARTYSLNHRLYINEPVSAIGYPSNYPLYVSKGDIIGGINYRVPVLASSQVDCEKEGAEWTSQTIIMLKIDYCIFYNKMIVTSVGVRPGNSGSPLVDFFGNAVGMISNVDQFGWGIAIPAKDIEDFLEEIE